MGHKDKASTNYSGGDSPKRLYLSPSTRTISPGIKVLPYAIAIFGVAFLVSAITASIVTPVQNSDAIGTEVLIDNTPVSYYVNIATNSGGASTISRDVYSTIAGTLGVITDTLHINSNTPNGYFVYLSAANGHNQYLTNEDPEYSSYHINPISGNGTVDNTQPVSLTNPGNLGTANTWGVAVADTYNAVFDAASAYASDSVITQTTKFAPVPAYGSEERLITRTGDTRNSGAGTIDTIPVYYGFHTNSSLPAGTYSDTVLYTAYAEATDQASGVATATYVTGPNGVGELSYKTGGVLTLTTSLYTDRTLSTSDATVTLTNNTTNESNNCPITSIGQVQKGTNDSIRIVCTAPIQSKPGAYTVHISIPGYAHDSIASVEYTSPGIVIASGTHAGTYKTMQAMTSDICHDWTDGLDTPNSELWNPTLNAPTAFTGGDTAPNYIYGESTTLGHDPLLDDYPNNVSSNITEAAIQANPTNETYWNNRRTARISNINATVPETYLQDNRDGNYYRVRKLADGNCWMTENLRLVFAEDTDQTADPSTYDIKIGNVASDGMTITPNGKVITTDNTQITAEQLEKLKPLVAKTEVGLVANSNKNGINRVGTVGKDRTIWGASDAGSVDGSISGKVKHSTTTSNVPISDDNSYRAATFVRSFYNSASLAYCETGLNAYTFGVDTGTNLGNCFVGDNDMQTAGTYYNFPAATAGVGVPSYTGAASVDNSICPKGWRLPASADGVIPSSDGAYYKSWVNLLSHFYNGGASTEGILNNIPRPNYVYKTYHSWAIIAMSMLPPFSLSFSGDYRYSSAESGYVFGKQGIWWTGASNNQANGTYMVITEAAYQPRTNYQRGFGFSVRCVSE